MSRFIKTKGGVFVLSSDVIKLPRDGKHNCVMMTRSGQTYSVKEAADELVRDIKFDFVGAIPAEPGYFVVEAIAGDKDGDAWKPWFIPVVGWSPLQNADDFDYVYEFSPILAGERRYLGQWALAWPDGKFTNSSGRSFKTVDEWLDYAKEVDKSDD